MDKTMFYVYVRKHEVPEFVNMTSQLSVPVEVSHMNMVVSGKSLMGMYEICLRGRILVHFPNGYSEDDEKIIDKIISRWIALEATE